MSPNPSIVRDEREPPRPARRVREPEPARDHRAQPVRADDERARRCVVVAPSFASTRTPLTRPRASRTTSVTRDALAHLGAGVARAVEQDGVEHRRAAARARDRESARKPCCATKSPRMRAPFGARITMPARCAAPARSTALERAHVAQNARRLRAQILGARLGAREDGAVEQQHAHAGARQRERGRRAGRSAADHEDVCVPLRDHQRRAVHEERGDGGAGDRRDQIDEIVVHQREPAARGGSRCHSRAPPAPCSSGMCRTSAGPGGWRRRSNRRSRRRIRRRSRR